MVHPSRCSQIAAVVILGLLSICASTQAQVFSIPQNISKSSSTSMTPQVAVDASGNIYAAWVDTTPGSYDILFSLSSDGGTTFSMPKNLSNSPGLSFDPRIAVDSHGAINVVWVDNTPGYQAVFFSRSTDGGATFSAPLNLSNGPADSASPQTAVDASGHINVVWENDDITFGVFYTHSADGGASFSTPVNLATNTTGSFAPQLALDASGNPYVAWEDDFNSQSDISFSGSSDQGATFSAPKNLSNNSGQSSSAQLTLDASGNINAIWADNTPGNYVILFSRSSDKGASFSSPKSVSNSPGSSTSPQIGVDAGGNIYAVWQGNIPPALSRDIFFSRSADGGATLAAPLNLANAFGSSPLPCLSVDAAGNINVSWRDTTLGNPQIFFTQSTDRGATFSATQNLSKDAGFASDVQMAADSKGNLDVVWSDDAPGVSQVFFSHLPNQQKANQPPVANAGADQTLPAAGPAGTSVTLNGSLSSDSDGDVLTFVWTQGGTIVGQSAVVPLTLNVGAYTFTLTVTDAGGLSSSAVTHVTITNRPPVANAGAAPVFQCAGPGGTLVKLDGSASADPNGYALKFVWAGSSGNVLANSAVASVLASTGTHTYTLTVTDSAGLSSKATTSVTVQDTLPPTLGVSLSTSVRRLKDNKLVFVNAAINVSDVCDPKPKVKLISITSNDPADRGRHGVSDIEAIGGGPVVLGTDVRSFLLRAERPENRLPLTYAVTYSATDASGNTTTTTAHWRVASAGSGNSRNNSQNGNNGLRRRSR